MKKYAVVISIVAVFAILSFSIAAVPVFQNSDEIVLNKFDMDPIIEAAIEKDVEEALAQTTTTATNIEENEVEEEPAVIGASSSTELPQENFNGADLKVESTTGGRKITGYNSIGDTLQIGNSGGTSTEIVEIGEGAFRNCKSLKTVDLSAATYLKKIDMAAFYGCTNLTTINLPASVDEIGGYAFTNTPWLTSQRGGKGSESLAVKVNGIIIDGVKAVGTNGKYEIGTDVTKIAPYAFAYNYTLTTIVFAERTGLLDIPHRAFANCTKLTTVSMTGVKSTAASAFHGCTALKEVKNFHSTFSGFGNATFNGCTALESCDFSTCNGAETFTIGDHAFMGCTALTSVKFPEKLTSIGTAAYLGCELLTSIDFPGNDTRNITLQQAAFKDCKKLATITKGENITLVRGTGMTGFTNEKVVGNIFYNTKITSSSISIS